MPIRWRLTLFHILTILSVVAIFSVVLVVVTIRGTRATVEGTTRAHALDVTRLLANDTVISEAVLAQFDADNTLIAIRDGQGNVIAESGGMAEALRTLEPGDRDRTWTKALETGVDAAASPGEYYTYAIPFGIGATPAQVVEAWRSYPEAGTRLVPYARSLLIAIPLAILAAIAGGIWLVGYALSPVDAITRSAREITESDLSQRVPVAREDDEFGRLATTFNDMLARLQVAFALREETLAEQRRFIADASHELRTPLTSLSGYNRLLRTWGLDDRDIAIESIDAMDREATRMSELIESLLTLARGDELAEIQPASCDIREVARAAVPSPAVFAGHQIRFEIDVPDAPVMASVDADRMRQLIAVLIDNAIKHGDAGGTISLSVREGHIGTEIEVRDTGPGIPADAIPHVFERFYRVDPSRTTAGAGLGLAIAKQIADLHAADIGVESELGTGSIFTVRLRERDC